MKDKKEQKNSTKTVGIKILAAAIISIFLITSIVVVSFEFKKDQTIKKTDKLFNYEKEKALDVDDLDDEQKRFMGISDDEKTSQNDNEYSKQYDELVEKYLKNEQKKQEEKKYTKEYKEYEKLSDDEKKEQEVIPRKEIVPEEKIEEIKKEIPEESVIPSKFNLADKIKLYVENQGSFGLCWDFASTKTLETFLALKENKNYNLSEIHTDYITSDKLYGSRETHDGGSFGIYEFYLKLIGPVLEEELEYKSYKSKDYQKFVDMNPVTTVTKTVNYPNSPAYNENSTEEEITEYRNLIKRHIMNNGALYAATLSPDPEVKYFDETTNFEYYSGEYTPSGRGFHAVAIVGWDDNYSKDNFTIGEKPKKDGAYLALNSWSANWGNGGYFYISYEDYYVERELSGILSTSTENFIKLSSINSNQIKDFLKENYNPFIENIDNEEVINDLVLNNLRYIDLSNKEINNGDLYTIVNDLNQISDHTTNDLQLVLSDNKLTDISPLSNLKNKSKFTQIQLSNNNISDISILQYFDNIIILEAENNSISDISGLSGLKKLSVINLSNNQISDITSLQNLENLNTLYLDNNKITSPKIFKDLNYLTLSNNPINWSEDYFKDITVYGLEIANTNFNDLKYLENIKEINILDISNNPIESIKGIDNFSLYNLNLSGDKIKDFELLENMKEKEIINDEFDESLEVEPEEEYSYTPEIYISANNCGIEDISVFNNLKIYSLSLDDNPIKDLSKFNNEHIQKLYLANSDLSDISNFNKGQISYIDLSKNPNIKGLESISDIQTVILSNNEFTNLDEIKKLTGVSDLDISYNKIKDFSDLKDFNELFALSIEGNDGANFSTIPRTIETLNVKNCNLQEKIKVSEFQNMHFINISDNNNSIDKDDFLNNLPEDFYVNITGLELKLTEDEIKNATNKNLENINGISIAIPYNNINQTEQIEFNSMFSKKIRYYLINHTEKDVKIDKFVKGFTVTGENPSVHINWNTDIVFEQNK